MSGAPGHRRSPPATAVSVALFGSVAVLLSGLGAAHLYHPFGGNTDTTQGSGIEASQGTRLAQSFRVSSPFTLTRVSLYLRDIGGDDQLWVGIRLPNAINEPEGAILAGSTNSSSSASSYTWTNFDLQPSVNVTPDVVYWIYANSSASSGHRWWNSEYDANATGSASVRLDGVWFTFAHDFAFKVFGWVETKATLVHRPAATTVQAGAETTFLVDVALTGLHPASEVAFDYWFLEGPLAFRRDSSGASGLAITRTESRGHLRYSSPQAPVGFYSFGVTFLANGSIPAGTIETANVSLQYRDFRGVTYVSGNVSASVRVLKLQITLVTAVNPTAVDPSMPVEFALAYRIDALNGTTVRDFRADLTFPEDVAFLNASASSTYSPGTRTVSWALGDLAPGSSGVVAANGTVAVGLPANFVLFANLTASYQDSNATRATLLSTLLNVTVKAPVLSIGLAANRTEVRSGDLIAYTLTVRNSGNGEARQVWINDTLDPRLQFRGDRRTGGDLTVDDRGVRWSFLSLVPGQTSIGLDVQAASLLHSSEPINNTVTFAYTDGAGHWRGAGQTARVSLLVRAPRLDVDFVVDSTDVPPGARVSERIAIRNVGNEPANGVVVNQLLGPLTRYESMSDGVDPVPVGSLYAWHLPKIAPGGRVNLSVVLRSSNGGTAAANVTLIVYGTYTDVYGRDTKEFTSDAWPLTVQAPPQWISLTNPAFVLLVASASILAFAGGIDRAYGRFRIEEVFLVRRDGILLIHRSRNPTMKTDSEVFAAMFTVVQDFIRDTFGYRPGHQLRELSFGKLSGLIAPGSMVYLAVMYSGRIGVLVRNALAHFVFEIEKKRGPKVDAWDGNRSEIEDIEARFDVLVRIRAGILIGLFPPRLRSRNPSPESLRQS